MGLVTRLTDFLTRRSRGVASPEEFDRLKQAALERVLGPMHGWVGHAIIPYQVGGPVDMYYFPQRDGSTAFATQELLTGDGKGPKPSSIGEYELVAFTRHAVGPADTSSPEFRAIENRIRGIFSTIGRYAEQAVLNPGETAEVPLSDDDDVPRACMLFDEYVNPSQPFTIAGRRYGLLLCIEVFRSELEYKQQHGGQALLDRFRAAGHWPFSDLDRTPVA
jgi:hypothetical protein